MHRSVPAIVLTTLLIAFSACQNVKSQPDISGAKTEAAQSASAAQTPAWTMTLTTQPNPPMSGKDALLEVTVADEAGKPVTGAEVKVDLKMQTMDMGKSEFTLMEKGAGSYQGTGQFTMAGPWNVVVTAAKGGHTRQQTFPLVASR